MSVSKALLDVLVNIVSKVSEDGRLKLMLFWGYTGWEFDCKSVRVTWSRLILAWSCS